MPRRGRQPLGHRGEPEAEGEGQACAPRREERRPPRRAVTGRAHRRGRAASRYAPLEVRPRRPWISPVLGVARRTASRRSTRPRARRSAPVPPVIVAATTSRPADAGSPVSPLKIRSPRSSVQHGAPDADARAVVEADRLAAEAPAAAPRRSDDDERPRELDDGGLAVPAVGRACRWPAADQRRLEGDPAVRRRGRRLGAAGGRASRSRRRAPGASGEAGGPKGRIVAIVVLMPRGVEAYETFAPVIAAGSRTLAICSSVRIFFSRMSSRIPRPVFIASAASSVALS